MGALRAPRRSLASVLCAALAVIASAATQSTTSTTREEPLARVEGPPESGVTLDGSEAALTALAAGDAAWKESARERAFDAWRQAIEVSRPSGVVVAPPAGLAADVDGTLPRRAEDVTTSVRRRLHATSEADRAAWRQRFEPLAQVTLDAAGGDETALRALEHAFPLTRAAALAALALADGALERAEADAARAWLLRARAHAADDDAELVQAVDRRALAATKPRDDDVPTDAVLGIELVRAVDLGTGRSGRARRPEAAIPGLAIAPDGTTWLHAEGRLAAFDADGRALSAIDVAAALQAAKIAARPSFSEPGAPWDDAIALDGGFLALIAGRAREDAGNALAGFDVRAATRLAWAWSARGLQRTAARSAPTSALVGTDALLEFQPGPCRAADLLVVHVRAWPRADGASPDLDEAVVEAWCAGLDPRDGSVRWTRRLATGATSRGLGRGRMSPPEPTSLPALPLATDGQRVAVDTGLGAIALLDAVDGRVVALVRTARSAVENGGRRQPAVGGIVRSSGPDPTWWFAPAESRGALLRLRDGPDADDQGLWSALPLPLEGPRIPVFASGPSWTALTGDRGRVDLRTQDLESGREARSVTLPLARPERGAVAAARLGSGWLVAAQGRAWWLDPSREMALQDEIEIGSGSGWPVVAIAVRGGLARIAGSDRLAFVRVR